MCMQAWGLSIISQDNMFVPQSIQYLVNETPVGRKPVLHLILQRQPARSRRYVRPPPSRHQEDGREEPFS